MNPHPRAALWCASKAALLALAALAADASEATNNRLPPALRGVDPRRISSGVYRALVGTRPAGATTQRAATVPPAVGLAPAAGLKATPPALLDARVSPNLRLGADPGQLPAGEINQAEPFIYRSAANPDIVLAVFQEGRFGGSEGGSADGGYALSADGGFTWARSLVPGLSQVTGGMYFRSTDPVSAIDLQGNLFLSTLDARNTEFSQDDLVISRSTDNGATWTQHVAYSTPNAQIFADKDWLAVNDYAGTPHAGRLVATFSGFAVDAQGQTTTSTLFALVSDDHGDTWSSTIAITPSGSFQGTQPYFLPDGTLICVYQSFASPTSNDFAIECSRSADGGMTWASAVAVAPDQVEYDDPVARTGGGLPGVAVARQDGTLFATWQATGTNGAGRILVSRSTDGGSSWGAPVVVSDNPSGDSVFNPGITVTPDGATATVAFYDKRLGPDTQHYVDLFAAQSFDGGATWSPEVRVSDYTTDLRLTVLSDTGYMLGDYLAIAPALTPTQGTIPVWCDTRYGNSDPFIARLAPVATADFAAWQAVRFSRTQLASAAVSGPAADPDGDGYENFAEYALGTDPLAAESGGVLAVTGVTPGPATTSVGLAWTERSTADFAPALQVSTDGGVTWSASPATVTATPNGASAAGAATLTVRSAGATLVRLALAETPSGPTVPAPDTVVVNGASTLTNLSSRGPVGSGASQLIAGFVTRGVSTTVLARAAGPALASFGVPAFLTDPVLTVEVTSNATVVASDDNWGDGGSAQTIATLAASLGAFPFANGSLDSALVTTLASGDYSATVTGAAGATGSIALVELYDAGSGPSAGHLVNVSTRGAVGTGASVMIAGFVISGPQPKRILLRSIGPSLASFGVSGTLADPQLAVFDASGKQIASNDDWSVTRSMPAAAATEARAGAFALTEGSADSALVLTLAPGAYTVQVSGVQDGTGNALVEIYDAD